MQQALKPFLSGENLKMLSVWLNPIFVFPLAVKTRNLTDFARYKRYSVIGSIPKPKAKD